MHRGYIKVWRKIEDSFFYKDSAYVHLWVHLLMKANHIRHEFIFNGNKMACDRGQCITGRNKLSNETGIEPSKVNRILKTLKTEQQIEQQTNSRFSLITILKYEDYQGDIEQPIKQRVNNKRTASEQPVNTNNNEVEVKKNEKNEEKEHLAGKPPIPIKKEPDHELQGVIDHICQTFEKKRNAKYPFTGKHAKIIEGLIRNYEHAGVKALWDCYLNTAGNNDFYRIAGWSIEVFATSMPGLLDTDWRSIRQKYETKSNGFSTPLSILKGIVSGTNKN
jgi:hypothetical protein